MMLALQPELVNTGCLEPGYIGKRAPVRERALREGLKAVTQNGVMGDPRMAERERGESYLAAYAELIAGYFRAQLGGAEEHR